MSKHTIKWLENPESHDFPTAEKYLSLFYSGEKFAKTMEQLYAAKKCCFKAKDIFRASGLSLLGVSNSHVKKDRKKIRNGIKLSPLLLVRDEDLGRMIIADGYHRLCAVYGFDEDAWIPCLIV